MAVGWWIVYGGICFLAGGGSLMTDGYWLAISWWLFVGG